jgi:hypothetical protein
LFIEGTEPGASEAVDADGLLYSPSCRRWRVDPLKAELGPEAWDVDVRDWLRRARRGVGVVGRLESETAFLPGERSWGGRLIGSCAPPKAEPKDDKKVDKKDDKKDGDDEGNGRGNGGGRGGGGGGGGGGGDD